MSAIILVASMACMTSGACGQGLVAVTPRVNLGAGHIHAELTGDIELRNDGERPIHIIEIVAACRSCTEIGEYSEIIEPGEAVLIPVSLRSLSFDEGPLFKAVTIRTNDPDQSELKVIVEGFFAPAVAIAPWVIDLGDVSIGEIVQRPIQLSSFVAEPAAVRLGEVRPAGLWADEITMEAGSPDSPARFDGPIFVRVPGRLGEFRYVVELKTDHPSQSSLHFVILGRSVLPAASSASTAGGSVSSDEVTVGGFIPATSTDCSGICSQVSQENWFIAEDETAEARPGRLDRIVNAVNIDPNGSALSPDEGGTSCSHCLIWSHAVGREQASSKRSIQSLWRDIKTTALEGVSAVNPDSHSSLANMACGLGRMLLVTEQYQDARFILEQAGWHCQSTAQLIAVLNAQVQLAGAQNDTDRLEAIRSTIDLITQLRNEPGLIHGSIAPFSNTNNAFSSGTGTTPRRRP